MESIWPEAGLAHYGPSELPDESVADYPKLDFPMREVRRVGEVLKGDIIWSVDREAEIRRIFQIANSWRDSHLYPMTSLRAELIGKIRRLDLKGVTVARLKRMRSIRRKLRTIPANLNQIQDLGGCRAILPSIDAVRELMRVYQGENYHPIQSEDDYIASPKIGGYRSYHVVLRFGAREHFHGRRIEIQLRTRLQHSWATAVESVGTFRNEDMKAGQGDAKWLRLFELMSAELALAESCALPPNVPDRPARMREIKALNRELNAIGQLENMRHAVRYIEEQPPLQRAKYYLIKYDNVDMVVTVKPHFRALESAQSYDLAELGDNLAGSNRFNTVLVEANKIDTLQEAYPNYFGDVQLFARNLKRIVIGERAKEYTMPPREAAPRPPREAPDLSWFRRTGRRRWPR